MLCARAPSSLILAMLPLDGVLEFRKSPRLAVAVPRLALDTPRLMVEDAAPRDGES